MINVPPLEPLGEEMSPSRRKKMEAIKKVKDFPYCREMRESASPTKGFGIHLISCLCWQFGVGLCSTAARALPYFAKPGSATLVLPQAGAAADPNPNILSPFHSGNKPGALASVSLGKCMLRNGWWDAVTALPGKKENIWDDSMQIAVKTSSRKAQNAQGSFVMIPLELAVSGWECRHIW